MDQENPVNSVGVVTPCDFLFGTTDADALPLDKGAKLRNVNIRYEVYGTLSEKKDNAILVEHALTGDAHLAGYHSVNDKKPGWWDTMVGPGKAFDTNKYFIVCSNIIGGCSGSTGPSSINPETGKPYNMDFPVITIGDMVRAQKRLMDHLGIEKWLCVAGGSMGGMLALQWGIEFPEHVNAIIAIATTSRISPQSIAFNWVGREAIMGDPNWKNGEYQNEQPQRGLAIARMLAHITYLSDESMRKKFGRSLQDSADYSFDFDKDFKIESYLQHQGMRFVERFDANSYLYITRAIDYFDVSDSAEGDLSKAFAKMKHAKYMVVSFSSDWLFPVYQSKELVKALLDNGIDTTYCNIESSYGHDAFLLETETLGTLVSGFLSNCYLEVLK